jgi:hypothetical protein
MEERDWWPETADEDESENDNAQSFTGKVIPDLFRRAVMTGIGSVLMTEEGIRSALSDMKMPREAVTYVVSQAERTKRDLIVTLARELRTFLDGLELQELISKSLQGKQFEIRTTIRVVEDASSEDGVKVEFEKKDMSVSFDDESDDKAEDKTPKQKTKKRKPAKRKSKTAVSAEPDPES